MKVILLNNIKKLGSRFDIVEVATGFAQNFLIPQKKALPATDESVANIDAIKTEHASIIAAEKADVASIFEAIDGKEVTITAPANEQGGLYESVTTATFVAALKDQYEMDLNEAYVNLESAIKQVGEYDVACSYDEASATCKLTVVAETEE